MPCPPFLNLNEVEALAKDILPQPVYDYFRGGSNDEITLRENTACYSRMKLMPRMLRNVSQISTSRSIPGLGINMSFPVMIAPMAMQGMAHPGREIATARAAKMAGIPYIMSTMATSSMEEVTSSGHDCLLYQLYVIKNRDIVKGWVEQAESLGFKALVVNVDAQRLGRREADERNRFSLPPGLELKVLQPLRMIAQNREDDRAYSLGGQHSDGEKKPPSHVTVAGNARDNSEGSGLMKLFGNEVDDSLAWDFIPWIRSVSRLPLIVKGLLSPEDAELAVSFGVDGIVVSNHGGRQLDGAPTALEALPAILRAVRGRVPVFIDGGIRRGTDVIKALAMGADAVLLGRPVLWGLAVGGEQGVLRVLQLLRAEIELAMALAGCSSLEYIDQRLLCPAYQSRM